jgi:putative ABC transport system permease protein
VLGQALGLAAAGTAAGLGLCVLSRRALASQLFGIGASDPAVLLGVAIAVTAIGLAASYLPARRAVKVDPLVTLRGQ